jgi:monoamine oxidase
VAPPDDVIVIGAGLSGLVCATRLVAGGARVRIVEARDRVGGRLLGRRVGDAVFDLGGQWWTAGQTRLAALADELGVTRAPQFRDGASVVAMAPSTPPQWLPGRVFAFLARGRRQTALSRMIARAGAGAAPPAWDGESLGAWLAREVSDPVLRDHVTVHCEMTFAVDPHELSLLDYLAQLGATDGHGDPFDGRAGDEHRLVPGAHALPARLAAALGDRVALSTPVRAVRDGAGGAGGAGGGGGGGGVEVVTDGSMLRADHVVLALPPAAARAIAIEPAPPAALAAVIAASRPGAVVKCVATYERAFWRDAGRSGEAYQRPGLVRATVDACSPDGTPALAMFVVAREAAAWSAEAPATREAAVLDELARLFGDVAATPTGFAFADWGADPWSGGCVATLPPGARSGGAAWRGPHGHIHVAGTEAAHRWPGFMDGAIDAGERAAAEILRPASRSA